jgi:chromosome segregation ATPase
MFGLDFIITFALMGLLFIRQVMIFKDPNKINYAPLLLGIGGIGAIVHLLLHPETENFVMVFRESLLPFFGGLMLFVIMNILQQTKQREMNLLQHEVTQRMMTQVGQLKEYITVLEENQHLISEQEETMRNEMKLVFQNEKESLQRIQKNQENFVDKIEAIIAHQEEALQNFENFTHKELPDIDNVIHRHIDMLRISEQDHFNQIKQALKQRPEQSDMKEEMAALHKSLNALIPAFKSAASDIVADVNDDVNAMIRNFAQQLSALRSQSDAIATTLNEDETLLESVKEQSQMLMKQMVLSAKQMDEVLNESSRVKELFEPLHELTEKLSSVHSDYISAKLQLDRLSVTLQNVEIEQLDKMRLQIDTIAEELSSKIESSIAQLHEHYHIAEKDISKTVQELATRVKMQKSYTSDRDDT